MLQNILELLEVVNGETENIKIAQGKYELPTTIKGGYKKLIKEIKWETK